MAAPTDPAQPDGGGGLRPGARHDIRLASAAFSGGGAAGRLARVCRGLLERRNRGRSVDAEYSRFYRIPSSRRDLVQRVAELYECRERNRRFRKDHSQLLQHPRRYLPGFSAARLEEISNPPADRNRKILFVRHRRFELSRAAAAIGR